MAEQNRTGPNWDDIKIFLALARHGTLSSSARVLGINHATVARRMQALEEAIGERLVDRRPDGYVLTPAGTKLLGPASEMEAAAEIVGRGGQTDQPKGLVRVNAPPSLAQTFLVKHLVRLSIEHTGLDIDVATDVRSVSLERREADIALRLERPGDGDVMAKKLVSFRCGFYGSKSWITRMHGGEQLDFVGFDENNVHLPDAIWLLTHFPKARISFRATNHLAQAAAAREGAGLALLPHFIAASEPDLCHIELAPVPPARDIWMIIRRQDRKDLSIKTVADHLIACFNTNRASFERPDRDHGSSRLEMGLQPLSGGSENQRKPE